MSLGANKTKKTLLSLVIAGLSSTASASDLWDCQQSDVGWICSANPDLPAEAPPSLRVEAEPLAVEEAYSQPEPATENTPIERPVATQTAAKDSSKQVEAAVTPDKTPDLVKTPEPVKTSELIKTPELIAQPIRPQLVDTEPRSAGVERTDKNLDWIPYAPMDAEDLVCKGRYLEPSIWSGALTPSATSGPTLIDADRSSSELGGISTLEGNILLQTSGRQIQSEYGEFDSQSQQAILRTDVRYREPGFLMTADTISANLQTKTATATDVRYVMHDQHLRGDALSLARYADQSINAQESLFTFCEPGSNAWAVRANELKLYPEKGFGEAWHTRFEVAGVPVFYLPYLYFPLDDTRITGFLYPSLSIEDTSGYDLAIPYYFNIAPNIDDTLTARIIENRGLMLENEFRYLNSFGMNQLSTGWLSEDDLTDNERWLFNFDHRGSPAPRWTTNVNFTRVSDDNYFDDLAPIELQVPSDDDLSQSGSLSYLGSTYSATALVHDYQTIDGGIEPYARMPQLSLNGAERYQDIQFNYQAQYTEFQHKTDTDGDRVHLRPSLTYDFNRPWGYLRPEAGIWYSTYELSDNSSPDRTVGFASLDSGLVFERQGELGTQTLEPRIKLISVDGDNTNRISPTLDEFDSGGLGFSYNNLFDTFGNTGNDRIARTQQATLGLESRVFSLTGREVLRLGVAQAYYFDDDHDPRPGGNSANNADRSDLALLASWRPTETLQLSHDSRLDEENGSILTQNYRMFFYPDEERLFYTGLRIDETDPSDISRQVDLAARWPLTNNWSLVGRWTEDLEASENIETLAGFEYESCCWKMRFTAQRSITDGTTDFERENKFYIQFILRGLGSIGQKEGRQFLRDLTGFNEDDNDNF